MTSKYSLTPDEHPTDVEIDRHVDATVRQLVKYSTDLRYHKLINAPRATATIQCDIKRIAPAVFLTPPLRLKRHNEDQNKNLQLWIHTTIYICISYQVIVQYNYHILRLRIYLVIDDYYRP